jgi:hypothetical protein
MKSVYSAVRNGDLNKAVCAPSFKGEVFPALYGKWRSIQHGTYSHVTYFAGSFVCHFPLRM